MAADTFSTFSVAYSLGFSAGHTGSPYQPWDLGDSAQDEYRAGYRSGILARTFPSVGQVLEDFLSRKPEPSPTPVLDADEAGPVGHSPIPLRSDQVPGAVPFFYLELGPGDYVAVDIARETEKAWLIRYAAQGAHQGHVCWFPKKALDVKDGVASIQSWFLTRNYANGAQGVMAALPWAPEKKPVRP
jgi:hypothetical protein